MPAFYTQRIHGSRLAQWAAGQIVLMGLILAMTAPSAWSIAKGWSAEKRLVQVSGLEASGGNDLQAKPPKVYPAIAADGDKVYVAYAAPATAAGAGGDPQDKEQGIGLLISSDRGKNWDAPINVFTGPCSAPAIWVDGKQMLIAWSAQEYDGESRVYQMMYAYSQDGGRNWKKDHVVKSAENSLSPRLIGTDGKVLLAWIETPTNAISTESAEEITPENIDLGTLQFKERGSRGQKDGIQIRIQASDYRPGQSSTFSPPRDISTFFATRAPQTFAPFLAENNDLILVYNRDFEIEFYRSKNAGTTWLRQSFPQSDLFNSGWITSPLSTPDGLELVRVERKQFDALPVNYVRDNSSISVSLAGIVRSVPRMAQSDKDRHVVWGGGKGVFTWISYVRTDLVRPTSKIVAPTDKNIRDMSIRLAWEGDDNISEDSELVYSYRFNNDPWSDFLPDTELEVPALPDGDHTFEVRTSDIALNLQDPPSKIEFNTFKVAPQTRITNEADTANTVNDRFFTLRYEGKDNTDESGKLIYEVKLDDGEWTPAQSPTQHKFDHLVSGQHRMMVRAKDRAGNVDTTPAVVTLEVLVGINVAFTEKPPEPPVRTKDDVHIVKWEGKDPADPNAVFNYFVVLDDGETQELGPALTAQFENLPEETHKVKLWATDSAGNRSNEVECEFFIDRTPPTTFASYKGSSTDRGFPQVTLRGEDTPGDAEGNPLRVKDFEYRFLTKEGEGPWTPENIVAGDTWVVSRAVSLFSWGYKVQVRAIDEGGFRGNIVDVDLTLIKRSPMVVYVTGGIVGAIVLFILFSIVNGRRKRSRMKSAVLEDSTATDSFSTGYGSDTSTTGKSESDSDSDEDNPFA